MVRDMAEDGEEEMRRFTRLVEQNVPGIHGIWDRDVYYGVKH